jgi:hypothetical protein
MLKPRGIVELGNPQVAFRRSYPQIRRRTQAHSGTGRDAGEDLERLIEPLSRGDPEVPLRWTCKFLALLLKTALEWRIKFAGLQESGLTPENLPLSFIQRGFTAIP